MSQGVQVVHGHPLTFRSLLDLVMPLLMAQMRDSFSFECSSVQ